MTDFKRNMKMINSFSKDYYFVFLNVFIASILTTLIGMNWPLIYKFIIDRIFIYGELNDLKIVILIYLLTFFFEKILQLSWKGSDAIITSEFMGNIKLKVYDTVLKLKLKDYENYSSGEVIDILNNDIEQLRNFLIFEVIFSLTSFIRLLMAIFYIARIDTVIGAIIVVVVFINYFSNMFVRRANKKLINELHTEKEDYTAYLYDTVIGSNEISLLNSQKMILKIFSNKLSTVTNLKMKEKIQESKINNLSLCISILSDLMIYTVSAIRIINGYATLGDFVALMIYYEWTKMFLGCIGTTFYGYDKSMRAIERIYKLLELGKEETEGEDFVYGDIEIENVTFSHHNRVVLKDINIKLEKDKITAIAAHSGTGKSTIANLILKLYDYDEGSIRINGVELRSINLNQLRNSVSIVRQEAAIFNLSIRDNIILNKTYITDEKIYEALKLAEAYDFVMKLPNKLDTVLDKNNTLSTGQLQRLMIARCLVSDSKVLIFDEATSNLDLKSEEKFINNISQIKKDKVIVIIAYRATSLKLADYIYYLEDGTVNDIGTHDELSERSDGYSMLTKVL